MVLIPDKKWIHLGRGKKVCPLDALDLLDKVC